MKKLFCLLFCITIIFSCDDGDIIITSFEFDEVDLQLCEAATDNQFVFFKINETINEAISLDFINDRFSDTIPTGDTEIVLDLSDPNINLAYRTFNVPITESYFCAGVPSGEIQVVEEIKAVSGTVTIITEITENGEDDNDGVDPEDEDINGNGNLDDDDTDGDGIPNYKDQDDDNDNVLTSVEITNIGGEGPKDTDEDGTPDYLDNDDDNDMVLTRNEDANQNGTPRDDDTDGDGQFDYLDADDGNDEVVEVLPGLDNTVQTTFRTTVRVSNLVFDRNNDNFEDSSFSFGSRDITIPKTTKVNE